MHTPRLHCYVSHPGVHMRLWGRYGAGGDASFTPSRGPARGSVVGSSGGGMGSVLGDPRATRTSVYAGSAMGPASLSGGPRGSMVGSGNAEGGGGGASSLIQREIASLRREQDSLASAISTGIHDASMSLPPK